MTSDSRASDIRTSGVVLAGGRSSRFGSDKMAAPLAGRPLVHHAIRAVAEVCEEVIVVAGRDGLPVLLPADRTAPILEIADHEPFAGPLAALLAGARAARGERLLVCAGDMPRLVPALLRRLLDWPAERAGACLEEDGWLRPLPCGLDRASALGAGATLTEPGHRSLRDLVTAVRVEVLTEADWRPLDPQAESLLDIDRPSDLPPSPDDP